VTEFTKSSAKDDALISLWFIDNFLMCFELQYALQYAIYNKKNLVPGLFLLLSENHFAREGVLWVLTLSESQLKCVQWAKLGSSAMLRASRLQAVVVY
jgi:hypothetical protein